MPGQRTDHDVAATVGAAIHLVGQAQGEGTLALAIEEQLALATRYDLLFSLAVFQFDGPELMSCPRGDSRHAEPEHAGRGLWQAVDLLREHARETDIVIPQGTQVAVVMPRTDLDGVCIFAEHIRERVEATIPCALGAGVATFLDGDTLQSLLARSDLALLAAIESGDNRVFRHTGEALEPILAEETASNA